MTAEIILNDRKSFKMAAKIENVVNL